MMNQAEVKDLNVRLAAFIAYNDIDDSVQGLGTGFLFAGDEYTIFILTAAHGIIDFTRAIKTIPTRHRPMPGLLDDHAETDRLTRKILADRNIKALLQWPRSSDVVEMEVVGFSTSLDSLIACPWRIAD